MAYSPTYTSDDTSPIVIDAGNKTLVQVGAFSAILGFLLSIGVGVFLYRWAMKKK